MASEVFIQWKGTDVCCDLGCECGYSSHIDGYFAYHVRCPNCGAVYKMPSTIELERVTPEDSDLVAMDRSEAINETSSIGGDADGRPWRKVKLEVPWLEARRQEHRV